MILWLLLLLFIASIIYFKLTKGRCKCNFFLGGKTALITGGNSGIGYQTALALAGRGCRVIIADKNDCEKSRAEIISATGNQNVVTKQFDLASLKSVRKLAKEINETEERLDILINNAGASALGNRSTEDGLHIGMQVNHFGSFLLTHLLIGLLKKSQPSRIIFVSSYMSLLNNLTLENLNYPRDEPKTPKSDFTTYANSKLCNIISANGFASRLSGTGITVNSLHPGMISTPMMTKYANLKISKISPFKIFIYILLRCYSKNAEEGAQTTIHLALAKEFETHTGRFSADCKPGFVPSKAKDASFAKQIWEASEKYVQLSLEERLPSVS